MMSLIDFLIRFYKDFNMHKKHQVIERQIYSWKCWIIILSFSKNIDIRRAESYIISPNWIADKKTTINPKNEKDINAFSGQQFQD